MPDPHQVQLSKAQHSAPQQKTSMAEAEIMEQAMREAIQEVMVANRASLMAAAAQGGQVNAGDDVDSSEDQPPTALHGTRSAGGNVNEQDGQGGPNSSPWGRRALGDDWYDERCIRCCVCRRPVCASVRAKRGQRCAGCLRWFHDACAPSGTLPADKQLKECDPTISGYLHCTSCSAVRQRLQQGAQLLCGKELGGGCSVTLVDLHTLRQTIKPGPYNKEQNSNEVVSNEETKSGTRSSKPFKRIAKQDLRTLKQLGPQYLSQPILDSLRPADHQQQGSTELASTAGSAANTTSNYHPGRRGLADLQAVVNIFKTYDRQAHEDDIMEDSWAAVLRCNNTPVSAASLLVMGSDHARLQALVTRDNVRRKGHARVLMSEVGTWLAAAGVPKLVAVLPERVPGKQNDDGEAALKRLRFRTLQDLQTLGVWKDTWFHYYTRDLIGRRPRVLVQELSTNMAGSNLK